jgi:hypothetical protein
VIPPENATGNFTKIVQRVPVRIELDDGDASLGRIRPGSGVSAKGPDHLTFDLADAAKMSPSFYGKRPGPGMRLDKLSMQFAMHDTGLKIALRSNQLSPG